VPGITDWTTNPSHFVDRESRTVSDVKPFTLQARQSGVVVTSEWNLKIACGRARMGVAKPEQQLSVSILGNPMMGETVLAEIRGAGGQPLHVSVSNLQGNLVSEERIGQASVIEHVRVRLSLSAGVYLLRVSSPGQSRVVRVLKTV